MIGAIAGDIIGSIYEHHPIKTKDFPLFHPDCTFTDDSVLTLAVAKAILQGSGYLEAVREMGRRYPHAGYGDSFYHWLFAEKPEPYKSWGNGAAMRVSPVGFAYNNTEEVLLQAAGTAEITHNHPEGIKGAQATALAVFLARSEKSKQRIKEEISLRFGYDLDRSLDAIRPEYAFDVSCQGTVPEAIIAFLEADSYEDAVRNAISLGGDSDTLACISGGIAEAYYGVVPEFIREKVQQILPPDLWEIMEKFEGEFQSGFQPRILRKTDGETPMSNKRFERNRFFLKDSIRKQIDFSDTDQNRFLPAPPLQKPCPPDAPRINLPAGPATLARLGSLPTGEAIARRESVRDYSGTPMSIDELAFLLWATQGVREVLSPECALRTVPSAGARHAFETYLVVNRIESLSPGLYRYLPFDHQLAQLNTDAGIGAKAAVACFRQNFVAEAAVTFFWTAIPARMEWRYDLAAHKVIALDAGHICQNLYLACENIDAGTCAIAAYEQEKCDRLLGVDGEEEFTIYIAPVGKR
jgi:SagB-type dehydrogenase family enzyme